jgi:hypothetical protein
MPLWVRAARWFGLLGGLAILGWTWLVLGVRSGVGETCVAIAAYLLGYGDGIRETLRR